MTTRIHPSAHFRTSPKTGGQIKLHSPTQAGFDQWQEAADKWTIHSAIAKSSMLAYYCQAAIKNINTKDIYKDYQEDATRLNGGRAFMLVAKELAVFCAQYQTRLTIVYIPPATTTMQDNQINRWGSSAPYAANLASVSSI